MSSWYPKGIWRVCRAKAIFVCEIEGCTATMKRKRRQKEDDGRGTDAVSATILP